MVKYAGFYPSDKPDPVTPRPGAGLSSEPRMRLASISEDPDGDNPFQEARTMDISARSTDFGVDPITQPARRDRAMVLRMDGVGAGQVVSVEQTPYTLGRHATNRLPIDDDSISRYHARFVCENGEYYVEDLGSRNGTFIQGKRVTRSVIKDDDWVQLGARVVEDLDAQHAQGRVFDCLGERLTTETDDVREDDLRIAAAGAHARGVEAQGVFIARAFGNEDGLHIGLGGERQLGGIHGHHRGGR